MGSVGAGAVMDIQLGRLTAWARSLPEGVDLPEHYPCTTQGVADIEALLAELERLRAERDAPGDWRRMVL